MAKNLFTLTVKTTTPADSELLVGGTGSANAYNFTWTSMFKFIASKITTGFIPYKTGSGYTDSPLYSDGTNVGQGTADPQTILDGFSSASRGLVISNEYPFIAFNDTDGSALHIGTQGNKSYFFSTGISDVIFSTNSITRYTIDGSGNHNFAAGDMTTTGTASAQIKAFKIPHPLKKDTHNLVHVAVESPHADLIYSDDIKLVNGVAEINIDEISGMTEGTFELLCRKVRCFTSNETSWDNVRGSVSGNIFTIESQNPKSNDTISWLVIGERQDESIKKLNSTDDDGNVIVEPLIPIKEDVK